MKKIFMVPPINFDVVYSINPWMEGNVGTVDSSEAVRQWEALLRELRAWGAEVTLGDAPPSTCPDAVFSANAGVARGGKFVVSRFYHAERQVEEPYFIEQFRKLGYSVEIPSQSHSMEGAGDALFTSDRRVLWLGYGFRTQAMSQIELQFALSVEVRPLRLVDPRFYHLDTCFCPLDDGRLLWYPQALDVESQAVVRDYYGDRAIQVSESDAVNFACNAISLGSAIVVPKISDKLFYDLSRADLKVISVNMSQFLRSGGACKCLTLELA